ncbi:hypothetical protein ABHN11_27800 [Brevibacillus centrosporus]|uniref:hypothetical protein n=1 Tax=Brevibacillus centrosporus TaxID=54910 RepID=UPI003D25036F
MDVKDEIMREREKNGENIKLLRECLSYEEFSQRAPIHQRYKFPGEDEGAIRIPNF